MKIKAKTLYQTGLAALILATAPGAPPCGMILTGQSAVVLASEFFYPAPSAKDIWQPSASDIARLEKLLPDFMRRQKDLPGDYQPLHEYYRQYVGIIRDGKKIIVMDGGAYFFHLQFGLATGTFSNLLFNGDA